MTLEDPQSNTSRSVLILGGTSGIGRAIAERMALEGWHVGVLGRNREAAEDCAGGIRSSGSRALGLSADVLELDSLRSAYEAFIDEFGSVDALVYCVGSLMAIGPFETVDHQGWLRDFGTSIVGFSNAVRLCAPALRKSRDASVTVLIGPGSNTGLPFASGYAIAQPALIRLVETLAEEFRASDVRFYALNPGLTPTGIVGRLLSEDSARRWLPQFNQIFAEGKEVGPEVPAEMACWLTQARPIELSGRVVSALLAPEILQARLARIAELNSGRLRIQ